MIPFPMSKAEAITAAKFNAQLASNCCSHDASATPNYWQRAIGPATFRRVLVLGTGARANRGAMVLCAIYGESIRSAKTRAA
jgi:hypothetical protein